MRAPGRRQPPARRHCCRVQPVEVPYTTKVYLQGALVEKREGTRIGPGQLAQRCSAARDDEIVGRKERDLPAIVQAVVVGQTRVLRAAAYPGQGRPRALRLVTAGGGRREAGVRPPSVVRPPP